MRKILFILRKVIKMHKVLLIMMALLLVPLQGWTDAHPPTGDNPPITDEDLGGVKAGAIVEWLVLDPPIMTGQGSVVAAGEDSLKDIYPKGEAQVVPEDGETFESPGAQNKGDTITWRRINFLDLGEQGITDKGAWPASGNCFDWKDWGDRNSVNNFTEYAVTWAMWNTSGDVEFFLGVDDSGVVYADGEEIINAPNASQDWRPDQHKGTASIAANKWIHIVVKVGESGGECGFTLRTEPVAGEVTTTGAQLEKNSDTKCSATFVVSGTIYEEDGKTPLPDGVEVTVKNVTRNTIQTNETGSMKIDGGYSVTLINLQTNTAACVGDEIEVTVSLDGRSGKRRYEVRQSDVDANKTEVDVVISSSGCDGTFVVNYSKGINMIAVPLDPGETWRMIDLLKHVGPEASMVIWYDKVVEKFTTLMPHFPENSPANTTVKGGEGYILIMTKAKEVTYEGKAWQNVSGIPSPTVVLSEGSDVKTPIFAVTGLIQGQDGSYLDGITVTVENLSTGQKAIAVTGTTAGRGRYIATLFAEGIAAHLDDTFLISAEAFQMGFTNNSVKLKITRDDIRLANVTFDFILEPLPSTTALLQNYPNPFNPETWIPFKLAIDSPVNISIYNAKGQLIGTIALGNKSAGIYTTKSKAAYWNGRDSLDEKVSSGVYYYQLQAGEFRATRKMVILK